MSFEHGSIKLDIRNPFRLEGTLRTLAGVLITLFSAYLLLGVAEMVAESKLLGWGQLSIAALGLTLGLRQVGSGLFQVMRFYVGRGIPLSLAPDTAQTNATLSQLERSRGRYTAAELEAMLVGRKNSSFNEPQGLLARLVHSLLPKLIFLPYALRNMATRSFGAVVSTLIALLSYAIISFVTEVGLVSEYGDFTRSVAQWMIFLYLLKVWYSAALCQGNGLRQLERSGATSVVWMLIMSVAAPILAAQGLATIPKLKAALDTLDANAVWQQIDGVSATGNLFLLLFIGIASISTIGVLVLHRMKGVNPVTEVAEYRDVWQEDVNPREIFIALETIVLANRRYMEIPNRVYTALDPRLNEQSDGKGAFSGNLMVETQPIAKESSMSPFASWVRLGATTTGVVLMLASTLIFLSQLVNILPLIETAKSLSSSTSASVVVPFVNGVFDVAGMLLLGLMISIGGRILQKNAHWFWAEIQFESRLISFKCEGTFKEARFTTGKGVYDSTQSENMVVRSDVTPWVTLSRIVTSTFAGTGNLNLEDQRIILEMHKDSPEMAAIIDELRDNLRRREKVASIRNDSDLKSIEEINSVNQVAKGNTPPAQIAQADSDDIAKLTVDTGTDLATEGT